MGDKWQTPKGHVTVFTVMAVLIFVCATTGVYAGLSLVDDGEITDHGLNRDVTVTSSGLFEISFSGNLNGSGNNICDLVNDPGKTLQICDATNAATEIIFGLVGEVHYASHNEYLDQCLGMSWIRFFGPYMVGWNTHKDDGQDMWVTIEVLENTSTRIQLKSWSYYVGYAGDGEDTRLNRDHQNEKIFTIYSDGKMFVQDKDILQTYDEIGSGSIVTYLEPHTNESVNNFQYGSHGNFPWNEDNWPFSPSDWAMQANHPNTELNFLLVREDLNASVSDSGVIDRMWRHDLTSFNTGFRMGWAFENTTFLADTTFEKDYYLQIGTANSSILPDIDTEGEADAYSADYTSPVSLSMSVGSQVGDGFDEGEGCYTVSDSGNSVTLTFDPDGIDRFHPIFKVNGIGDTNVTVVVGGATLTEGTDYLHSEISGNAIVHLMQTITSSTTIKITGAGASPTPTPTPSTTPSGVDANYWKSMK